MPRLTIEWVSAGYPDQDEALADEIADHAMESLDGHDPIIHGDLAFDPRPEVEASGR